MIIDDPHRPTNPISEELKRFAAVTFTADQLKRFPTPDWLIEGVLLQQSLVFFQSVPKVGKSFVVMDWALSIATGRKWFNRDVAQGNSLYIFGEGSRGFIGQRIDAWEQSRGMKVTTENFLAIGRPIKMLDNYAVELATQLIKEQESVTGDPTRLVIIDTFSRSVVGHNENDMAEMSKVIERADEIKEHNPKITLLFVHHSSTSGRMRGSTALGGGLDTEIEMLSDGEGKRLHCVHQKDAKPFEDIPVYFREIGRSVVPSSFEAR